jgi:hypothetical protein
MKNPQVEIGERDIALFLILQRYRYLPTRFLSELLDPALRTGYGSFKNRLTKLQRAGYLRLPHRQANVLNAHCKDNVYELGKEGKYELETRGLRSPYHVGFGKLYRHELIACLVQASIETACSGNDALQYVPWTEVMNHPEMPASTKNAKDPFAIPVVVGGRRKHIKHDAKPFAIRYTHHTGQRVPLNFTGFEVDCATEPLEPLDIYQRSNIEFKFRAIINMAQSRTFRTYFGFKNMVVPFVTTSQKRLNNMMKLLEKVAPGGKCTYIIFKYVPDPISSHTTPNPEDFLLTEPWHRVGYPPFDLVTELQKQIT